MSLDATKGPPADARAICLDIGGSYMKFGFSQGPGLVSAAGQIPTPARDWRDFTAALDALLADCDPGRNLPLAISVAATLDRQTGEALSVNIPGLIGHELRAELSRLLGRPVVVANDADSFALAEARVGAGRGHDVVFALILGTGVGGGLVIDGRAVSGPSGVVAEWGHGAIARTEVTLPEGAGTITLPRLPCGCGRSGCLDTIGGARGMERLYLRLTGAALTSHQLLDAWEAGDPATRRVIAVWTELLAEPLAYLANVLGATSMPVGGGLAARGGLIATLDAAVRARTLHRFTEPLVMPGLHFREGGLVGVSVLAETLLSGGAT